ncbi:MAG: hypothetical protein KBH07_05290 [Flavobacteriales bacterium]|nr:hypothetical protein [Flavobacteriales bacterium]MBP9080058.1 hypothetical protein [Flavobacteriales bacterium]
MGKYKLPKGSTLAILLPPTAGKELQAAFLAFGKVICGTAGMAQVTRKFHTGFAAQMGAIVMN